MSVGKRRAASLLAILAATGCFRPSPVAPPASGATATEPLPARSSSSAPPPQELDLAGALALVEEKSFDARLARVRVARARAEVEAAKQLRNPEVEITRVRPSENQTGGPAPRIALEVPLPRPWERDAEITKAELGVAKSEAESRSALVEVRALVVAHFLRLDAFRAMGRSCATAREEYAARESLLAERMSAGTATTLDAVATKERRETLEEKCRGVALRGRLAESDLRALLQLDRATSFSPLDARRDRPRGTLRETDANGEDPAAVEKFERARAEADLYVAKNAAWPWIRSVEVGYLLGGPVTPENLFVGASIEIPLLSLHGGDIAVASAKLEEAELREAAASAEAQRRVAAASEMLLEAEARRAALETRLEFLRGRVLPEAESAQRAGVLSDSDLFEQRSRVRDLELELLEAQLAESLARLALELPSVTIR